MEERVVDWLLAVVGGFMLTLMISANSLLAKYSSPLFASWFAYGIGSIMAFILVLLWSRFIQVKKKAKNSQNKKMPWWIYLGGIPGAMTVILAALTVNSTLALSGSFAFMLLGQVVFGVLSDHFGFFGTSKRKFAWHDLMVIFLIISGCSIIVYCK